MDISFQLNRLILNLIRIFGKKSDVEIKSSQLSSQVFRPVIEIKTEPFPLLRFDRIQWSRLNFPNLRLLTIILRSGFYLIC
jgi:hypothetical protein